MILKCLQKRRLKAVDEIKAMDGIVSVNMWQRRNGRIMFYKADVSKNRKIYIIFLVVALFVVLFAATMDEKEY